MIVASKVNTQEFPRLTSYNNLSKQRSSQISYRQRNWRCLVPFFMIGSSSPAFVVHSLIRGVLIQSCSAGAKNFTNYVFCHSQFSGVIQNIQNCCAISAKFWKNWFLLYKIGYFDNNQHRQQGFKWHNDFQYFGWHNYKIHNWWNFHLQ